MNVYDFDNTIYDGESVFDFYLYSVRRQPRLIRYLFIVVKTFLRYKLCRITTEEFQQIAEKHAQRYLSRLNDIDFLVKDFWDKNEHKVKSFYLRQMRSDDVIISASVDFLLEELLSRIGVKNYLATKVDKSTGEVQKICYRKNKVQLFREKFPHVQIENFYTDSKNDAAMMKIAKHTYIVKGSNIEQIDEKFYDECVLKNIG